MKTAELELEIKTELGAAGFDDPGFEARQLISGVLNLSAGELLMREHQELGPDIVKKSRHWAAERVRGVPLAYLTGKKGFFKYEFFVEPGVLVPRPESEHAIEVALRRTSEQKLHIKNLADLGSGTGILGLSLLVEFPAAHLTALDISAVAARVTRRNAEKLSVGDRFTMVEKAVEDFVPSEKFDLVVANPPYIAKGDANVQPSVVAHEPHEALFADGNGLGAIARWSRWVSLHLAPGGIFVCEIGTGQSAEVRDIMSGLNFREIRVEKDLAGHDRIVSAVR
jgi:release factor glutamine methyltransferase